jgi:hypothetical protein
VQRLFVPDWLQHLESIGDVVFVTKYGNLVKHANLRFWARLSPRLVCRCMAWYTIELRRVRRGLGAQSTELKAIRKKTQPCWQSPLSRLPTDVKQCECA